VRLHEIPEIIRVAAPVYVKFGLRNAPDLYPAGGDLLPAAVALSCERVRRAPGWASTSSLGPECRPWRRRVAPKAWRSPEIVSESKVNQTSKTQCTRSARLGSAPTGSYIKVRDRCVNPPGLFSRLAEDVVGADPAPYHVRLSLALLLAVLKGGPAIGSPGHLEDPGGALDRLHAQAAPDAAPAQVSYEGSHRRAVNAALRWCERIQVALKAIGRRPSGQPSALVERGQKGVVGVEDFEPASRDIGRGLSLARLPSGRPEPSLGGIDQGLLASAAR